MLLIFSICILICLFLQIVLRSDTKRDTVLIYSICASAVVAFVFGCINFVSLPFIDAEAIVYWLASVVIYGIVGGVIGFNLGGLFFKQKFKKKKS